MTPSARRPRALQIWAETGKILGVDGFAAGGLVKGYAAGGPTRGGFGITDKGLVIPIIADVQKVIPPDSSEEEVRVVYENYSEKFRRLALFSQR